MHPEPALLRAIDEGVVPEEVTREVREHLAECEICVQLRDDLASLAESPVAEHRVRGIASKFLPGLNTWWAYGAVAAAVAFVIFWPREQAPAGDRSRRRHGLRRFRPA